MKSIFSTIQVPTAKLCYNNSPSFNWTLSFRKEVLFPHMSKNSLQSCHMCKNNLQLSFLKVYEELSASRDMSIYDKVFFEIVLLGIF